LTQLEAILLQTESVYDFVQKEPRYQAVVRKAGLQLLPDKESHWRHCGMSQRDVTPVTAAAGVWLL
jgi:hypothetical protein